MQWNGVDVLCGSGDIPSMGNTDMLLILFLAFGLLMGFGWIGEIAVGIFMVTSCSGVLMDDDSCRLLVI